MRVAVAQLDPIVGDLRGNIERMERALEQCRGDAPDLVVFTELFLVGYPPNGPAGRPWFIDNVQVAVKQVVELSPALPRCGHPLWRADAPATAPTGGRCAIRRSGLQRRVVAIRHKMLAAYL